MKPEPTRTGTVRLFLGLLLSICLFVADGFAGPFDQWSGGPGFTTETLVTLAYGNGVFVAVGDGGSMFMSADGTNWMSYSAATNVTLYAIPSNIVFANGSFVAFGSSGTDGFVQMSPDAINWSNVATFSGGQFTGLAYGNGAYVAVGQARNAGLIAVSTNGLSWSSLVLTDVVSFSSVTCGNGTLLAAGRFSTNTALYASADGSTWTRRAVLTGTRIGPITYGNGMFVVNGPIGFGLYASRVSRDGIDWSGENLAPQMDALIFGNALFAGIGAEGAGASTDGVNWTITYDIPRGQGGFGGITYGAGRFVAVGTYGLIARSSALDGYCFMAASPNDNGSFRLTVTGGAIGHSYHIQANATVSSTNWVDLFSYTNAGDLNFLDTGATNYRQRLYRVVSP